MQLTFAQNRLLKRLADTPGAALSIETVDEGGYERVAKFRGWFHHPSCPTCHHTRSEPANWLLIHRLAEAGAIKDRFGWFHSEDITESGRAALQAFSNKRASAA